MAFKCTHIIFEDKKQRIADLIARARYHAQTNRQYSLEIIVHLQDCAINNRDNELVVACRNLMEVVSSPSPYTPRRTQERAADENNLPREKKTKENNGRDDFEPIGQTFNKTVQITDFQLRMISQRLVVAGKLAKKCSAADWDALFSGEDRHFTIKWKGHPGELRDLFDMLTKRGKEGVGYITPRYHYQLIVRSHFIDANNNYYNSKNFRKQRHINSFAPVLEDCENLIKHLTEHLSDKMRGILEEQHSEELSEYGYKPKKYSFAADGMSTLGRRH